MGSGKEFRLRASAWSLVQYLHPSSAEARRWVAGAEPACDGRSSQCELEALLWCLWDPSREEELCSLWSAWWKSFHFFGTTMCPVSVIMLNSTAAFTRSKIADWAMNTTSKKPVPHTLCAHCTELPRATGTQGMSSRCSWDREEETTLWRSFSLLSGYRRSQEQPVHMRCLLFRGPRSDMEHAGHAGLWVGVSTAELC